MRIVYLNPCGQMGGAETSLVGLLASVRAAEPDWQLRLVLGEDGPLARKAEALGVPVIVMPFPVSLARLGDAGGGLLSKSWSLMASAGSTAFYVQRLRRLLQQEQPQIIHSNGFKMHMLAAWSRPHRTPVLWHIHDYVSNRPLMSRLLRRYAGKCTAAIVNSGSVAADVRKLCPDLPVTPIHNAVDLARFTPQGETLDLDRLADLPRAASGTVRVGMVATFAKWKGHEVFLRALSLLPAGLALRGYVIGGPIYQTAGSQYSFEALRHQAAQLKLDGRVGFTGFVDDTAAAMRSLDIVVHASTQPEPFGMVIIEGMACGRAVIASPAGGAVELLEAGENALTHPPGDAAALSQQILRLAAEPELRQRLGQAGRATIERSFHYERLARELTALYRRICPQIASFSRLPACAEPDSVIRRRGHVA